MNQDQIKQILVYDQDAGIFTWAKTHRRAKSGCVAGSKTPNGYIAIHTNGRSYYAHRLAYLYVFGEFDGQIDHINRDKADNRICNLRTASNSQNGHNKPKNKNNTSGYKGVSWCGQVRKWKALISINGKRKHLGAFDCPVKAGEAYAKFKDEFFRP